MTDASSRKIVLVVDDMPANIAVLVEILKGTYQVRVAKSGDQAVKIAHAAKPPDLMLLDVEMPGMNGYQVFESLSADDSTRGIPVIFVTGHNDPEQRQKGLALGAKGYLSKPVDPAVVLDQVAQVLA